MICWCVTGAKNHGVHTGIMSMRRSLLVKSGGEQLRALMPLRTSCYRQKQEELRSSAVDSSGHLGQW